MTTTLVRRSTGEVDTAMATRLSKSRLVPEKLHKDPASVEYMMRIGAALGIDPTSAFQHIFVFESKGVLKAGMSSHLMHALAIAAGHSLHVEGDAVQATAVLIRHTTDDELHRYQRMREEERRMKLATLEDTKSLYTFQRTQILERVEDLQALGALGESIDDEVRELRQQLASLHGQYDFDALRQKAAETAFDLTKIARFESVWTRKRANNIPGLTEKGTWQNYGPEMLKSRAKASVVRDGAIEVILGVRGIFADLGVEFSGNADDELAMSVAYTPEEQGAEVDGDEVPLNILKVRNVADERENRRLAAMMDASRGLVEKLDAPGLLTWAAREAGREDVSAEDKTSRLMAVLDAARTAGKAEELLPKGDEQVPLSDQFESFIASIR